MSTQPPLRPDPRREPAPPALRRPRFFDGRFLTAADLTLEQTYLRDRLRLYKQALHGWGVVFGLAVKMRSDGHHGCLISVEPGYAIDASGEDVFLLESQALSLKPDALTGGRSVTLQAARVERGVDPAPKLLGGGAKSGTEPSAVVEEVEIEVVAEGARPSRPGLTLGRLEWTAKDGWRLDLSVRRPVSPLSAGPNIVHTSWTHGGATPLSSVAAAGLLLEIGFDHPVVSGVDAETFELTTHHAGVLRRVCPAAAPHLSPDGMTARLRVAAGSGLAGLAGQVLRVRLHCDFLVDADGLPVSGRHVGGRLPTGSGGAGGDFDSWFTLSHDHSPAAGTEGDAVAHPERDV